MSEKPSVARDECVFYPRSVLKNQRQKVANAMKGLRPNKYKRKLLAAFRSTLVQSCAKDIWRVIPSWCEGATTQDKIAADLKIQQTTVSRGQNYGELTLEMLVAILMAKGKKFCDLFINDKKSVVHLPRATEEQIGEAYIAAMKAHRNPEGTLDFNDIKLLQFLYSKFDLGLTNFTQAVFSNIINGDNALQDLLKQRRPNNKLSHDKYLLTLIHTWGSAYTSVVESVPIKLSKPPASRFAENLPPAQEAAPEAGGGEGRPHRYDKVEERGSP